MMPEIESVLAEARCSILAPGRIVGRLRRSDETSRRLRDWPGETPSHCQQDGSELVRFSPRRQPWPVFIRSEAGAGEVNRQSLSSHLIGG